MKIGNGLETSNTAADQAMSDFLAAAGHDLRQPMQAAKLFVSALKRMAADDKMKPALARDCAVRSRLWSG